jgi:hypothetical protein
MMRMLDSVDSPVERKKGMCDSVQRKGFIHSQQCFRKDRLSFSATLASILADRRIPLWSYQTRSQIHCPPNMSAEEK